MDTMVAVLEHESQVVGRAPNGERRQLERSLLVAGDAAIFHEQLRKSCSCLAMTARDSHFQLGHCCCHISGMLVGKSASERIIKGGAGILCLRGTRSEQCDASDKQNKHRLPPGI